MIKSCSAIAFVCMIFLASPALSGDIAPLLQGKVSCGGEVNEPASARAMYWFDKGVSISLFSAPKPLGTSFIRIMLELADNKTKISEMRLTFACNDQAYSVTATPDNGLLGQMLVSWRLENDAVSLNTRGEYTPEAGQTGIEWDLTLTNLKLK